AGAGVVAGLAFGAAGMGAGGVVLLAGPFAGVVLSARAQVTARDVEVRRARPSSRGILSFIVTSGSAAFAAEG
ncbi:MAG TPA: hypothetical protein VL492_10955, partial [Methylovirgula sp.]|nr:hypothetical protein [Methylovirgula sp.]